MRVIFLGVDCADYRGIETRFEKLIRQHFDSRPDWVCANKFDVDKVFGRDLVSTKFLDMQEAQKVYEKDRHRMIIGCRVDKLEILKKRILKILPVGYLECNLFVSLEVLDAKEAEIRFLGERIKYTRRINKGFIGYGDIEKEIYITANERTIFIDNVLEKASIDLFNKIDGAISGLVIPGSGKVTTKSLHYIPKGFEESVQFEDEDESKKEEKVLEEDSEAEVEKKVEVKPPKITEKADTVTSLPKE